jgi:hypothetical protein
VFERYNIVSAGDLPYFLAEPLSTPLWTELDYPVLFGGILKSV